MKKFILVYHTNGTQMSKEAGAAHRARYQEWMQSLGDALVSPANPMGPSKFVSAAGVRDQAGAARMMGYSVLQLESMDAALDAAKRCPFMEMGELEVAELLSMGG